MAVWERALDIGIGPFRVEGLAVWKRKHLAEHERQQVRTQIKQAELNAEAPKIVDTITVREPVIIERTRESIREVEKAPDAQTPVSPELDAAVRDGLRDIRSRAVPDS